MLGVTTSTGYLYIVLVLLVGLAMGDNGKYTVRPQPNSLQTDDQTLHKDVALQSLWIYILRGRGVVPDSILQVKQTNLKAIKGGDNNISVVRAEERPPTVRRCCDCHNKWTNDFQGQTQGLLDGCDVNSDEFYLPSRCDLVCTRCVEKINKSREKTFIYIMMQNH